MAAALLDMKGFAQRPQACFMEGLAQGWMSVDGAADIFQSRPHLEREAEGGSEFRHTRADRGDAEKQVIIGPYGHPHEPVLRPERQGPAVGLEREQGGMHLMAGLARLVG